MSYSGNTSQPDHADYVKKLLVQDGEDKDWEVVLASDYMLKVFLAHLEILEQAIGQSVSFTTTNSRSGNKHVIVHLPKPLSKHQRIAWQAILGSDLKREALHLLAITKGEKNPILLVMPRAKNLLTEGAANENPSDSLPAIDYTSSCKVEASDTL